MPVNYPKQKKKKITPPRKPVRPADVPRRKTMAKPRPVRFEDGQIDKGIAFLSPDKPPRRKAAAKRCVMGGRPARSIEDQLDAASEAFMLKVIKGESFEYLGPTGKRCSGPAPVATRASVASTWLKKRRPDLTATAIAAKIQTEDVTEELPTDRQLTRLIANLIFESRIESDEVKAIAAPIVPDYMNTLPEAEMHSVGAEEEEGKSHGLSRSSSPRRELPPDHENPKSGDRHDLANGSHVRFIENDVTQARWLVYDNINVFHGFRYTFKKAIEHARSLPPGEGPHQIDPFHLQRAANEEAENPYRYREAMPLGRPTQIRNITQTPKAWKPRRQR